MKIEILGTGCPKCHTLAENAKAAAERVGAPYELCKITNLKDIMNRGVMFTPALAVDGEVKLAGKVASPDELVALLTAPAAQ